MAGQALKQPVVGQATDINQKIIKKQIVNLALSRINHTQSNDGRKEFVFGQIYTDLFNYFFGDGESKYDRSKGLLIIGNIGSGKTTIMKLFAPVLYQYRRLKAYEFESIRAIERAVLRDYSQLDYFANVKNLCVDEIGEEQAVAKIYGNESNVFKEIILDRYETYKDLGNITHGISNLTTSEIQARYGEKIYSRICEMFNIVKLTGKDKRK